MLTKPLIILASVLGSIALSVGIYECHGRATINNTKIQQPIAKDDIIAIMHTNFGNITLKLFPKMAPKTVSNFIHYARAGTYNNTIFHKVINHFMIQGGGYTKDLQPIHKDQAIINEASPKRPNSRGTIAMARSHNPDSATSEFFINLANNSFLDIPHGYAVFGVVVSGMETIDRIAKLKTTTEGFMENLPAQNIIIESIELPTPKSIIPLDFVKSGIRQ